MTQVNRRTIVKGLGAATLAPAGATIAVAQGKPPIRIGFSVALTGTLAGGGKSALVARNLWKEDINARGGILGRPVEFVYYDDQSNGGTTPGIYAKLLDVDKVDFVYGPYGAVVQGPLMPFAKQRDILIFGNFAFAINNTLKHDKYFHFAPYGGTADAWTGGFVRVAKRAGAESLAILAADTEAAPQLVEGAIEEAKRLGIAVTYNQKFPLNLVDFSQLLRAIRTSKAQSVLIVALPNDSASIVRSVNEVGVGSNVKVFGGGLVGLQYATLLQSLGSQLNGIVNFHTYVPEKTMDHPGVREFLARYAAKAKEAQVDPLGHFLAPFNYAMGEVLEQAVAATGSLDHKVLAKFIHSNEFSTVAGKIRFDEIGEWVVPRAVQVQFQGIVDNDVEQFRQPGKQVILEPAQLASGELRTPFEKARS